MLIQKNLQQKSKEDLINTKKELKSASKISIFQNDNNSKEFLNHLKNEIYFNKNYSKSQEMIEKLFDKLRKPEHKNKHKCNRINDCECIVLGCLLIDNLFFANTKNDSFILIKEVEKYFMNPDINLPFKLFIKIVKIYLGQLKYDEARSLIENYITYSAFPNTSIVTNNTSKKSFIKKTYELNTQEYMILNHILTFDIILVTSGFSKAKSKIMSLESEEIKKDFLEKLIIIYKQCMPKTGNGANIIDSNDLNYKDANKAEELYFNGNDNKNKTFNSEIESKSEKIVQSAKNAKINFGLFSKFFIKNSIGEKAYNIILKKKFISALILIATLYLLYKFYVKFIYQYGIFTNLYSKLVYISFIRKFVELLANFLKNSFNLLFNY